MAPQNSAQNVGQAVREWRINKYYDIEPTNGGNVGALVPFGISFGVRTYQTEPQQQLLCQCSPLARAARARAPCHSVSQLPLSPRSQIILKKGRTKPYNVKDFTFQKIYVCTAADCLTKTWFQEPRDTPSTAKAFFA